MLKSRETYEIMRAQDVGWSENRIVLGKHSGRNALRSRLLDLGIELKSEEELNEAFAMFKDLADKKHEIFDEDLQALVTDSSLTAENERFKLVSLKQGLRLHAGFSPRTLRMERRSTWRR